MPWKESDTMSERMKFVARLLEGERMSDVCREFEISRKTGYKIFERYKKTGLEGLVNQSRSAKRRANQTPQNVVEAVLEVRLTHPTWGAPKIKDYLNKKHSPGVIPASSTIHAILARNELIKKQRRGKNLYRSKGTDLQEARQSNEVWCTDFKGQFKLKNDRYCYPLTLSDRYSRYLLMCEGLECIDELECISLFDQAFTEYGLPDRIHSDNGVPFGSKSHFGISRLSVRWLRLGISIQRSRPGKPQDNGSHERMHRTLKAEATKPPASNFLSQQEVFDDFRNTFNFERPHQAIAGKSPSELYKPSSKIFKPILEELDYPGDDYSLKVSKCGSINLPSFRIYVGTPFASENLGVKLIDEGIWRIRFMDHELGFFDNDTRKMQIGKNPFLNKSEN